MHAEVLHLVHSVLSLCSGSGSRKQDHQQSTTAAYEQFQSLDLVMESCIDEVQRIITVTATCPPGHSQICLHTYTRLHGQGWWLREASSR
jgi:hypothetical protein